MKTISPQNDTSSVVNLEFRDNPEKWHVWKIIIASSADGKVWFIIMILLISEAF